MTKEKLSKSLAGVARLRLDLDGATDSLNSKIAEFEKEFGAIAGGTRLEVVIGHDVELQIHDTLVFSRYNGSPRLLIVESTPGDEDKVTPLSGATRAERLIAVNLFPALIEGLEKALQEQLKNVAEGAQLADQCIEVVRAANNEHAIAARVHKTLAGEGWIEAPAKVSELGKFNETVTKKALEKLSKKGGTP
jgi:hypothetical protein